LAWFAEITLKVDTAPLATALEYFLGESQWIDWVVEGKETALRKVTDAVRRHMAIPSEVRVIGTRESRGRYRNTKLPRTVSIIVLVAPYRSNLVDRMIEDVVRSTPSRAPIRSMT
jgi:hypothetical protein